MRTTKPSGPAIVLIFWIAVMCALLCVIWSKGGASTQGCGVLPVKPVVPIGCKDLTPQCVCDAAGKNCAWQWVCVKD